ncbi:nSTAND1 domain-containing NTPase [Streptomyces sp. NPDC002643]
MGRREKPVDPDAGPVQRLAHDLRVLRETAGKPTYRAMAGRTRYSVSALSQAAAGEQLPSLALVLAYVEALDADPGEWEERWRQAHRAAARSGRDGEAAPPYRGLARYEPGDRDLFFGRDNLVGALWALVREHRFAAVVGPSGSGKSSLLRAGLIPRLQHAPDTDRPAVIRVLTPGGRPVRTHTAALTPQDAERDTWVIVDQFEELFTLCQDSGERDRFLDLLLTARYPGSRLRVVVAVRADFYGHCAAHRELADALSRAGLLVGPMDPAELREVITGPAAAAGLSVEHALTARIVDEVTGRPGALPLLSHALLETWRHRRGRTLTTTAYEEAGGVHGALTATAEHAYAELTPAQARIARRVLLRLIAPGRGTADTRRPAARAELDATEAPGHGRDVTVVVELLAAARLITLDDGTVELAHEALISGWPRLRDWIEEDRERLRERHRLSEAARAWEELGQDPGALYRGTRLSVAEELFAAPDSAAGAAGTAVPDRAAGAAGVARTAGTEGTAGAAGAAMLDRAAGAAGADGVAVPDRAAGTAGTIGAAGTARAAGTAGNTEDDDLTRSERAFLTAALAARDAERAAAARTARRFRALSGALSAILVLALAAGLLAWQQNRTSERERAKAAARRIVTVADSLRSSDPRTATLLDLAAWRIAPLTETRAALLGALVQPERDTFTDPETGPDALRYLTGHGRSLISVAGGRTVLRDVTGHRPAVPVRLPKGTQVTDVSPDGGTLLLTGGDGDRLWDLSSGGAAVHPGALRDAVPLDFGADGRSYVLGTSPTEGRQGRIQLRELGEDKALFEIPVPTPGDTAQAAVGAAGRLMAVCFSDGPLQVWDTARRERLRGPWDNSSRDGTSPRGTCGAGAYPLRFSPDGRLLAVVSETRIRLWDIPRARLLTDLESAGDTGPAYVDFSPDGAFLATADDEELDVWRLTSPAVRAFRHPLAGEAVHGLAWDPGPGRVLRFLVGATVHTYDLGAGLTPRWQSSPAESSVLGPDGTVLATADRAGATRWALRSTRTGAVLAEGPAPPAAAKEPAPDAPLPLVAFSPDGRALAISEPPYPPDSGRQRVTVWDVTHNRARASADLPTTEEGMPVALALGPDGRTLLVAVAGHDDGVVEVWDVRSGRFHRTGTVAGLPGATLAVRPDGRLLAGAADRFARLPSGPVTGRALSAGRVVNALAFSPDSTRLAAGDSLGRVTLWDGDVRRPAGVLAGTSTTVFHEPPEAVTALAFSPDGRTLAVGGGHGTLQLWDTASRQLLAQLPTPGEEIRSLAFARDGRTVYAGSWHAPLQSHTIDPERAATRICDRTGSTGLTRAQWTSYLPDVPYRRICGKDLAGA